MLMYEVQIEERYRNLHHQLAVHLLCASVKYGRNSSTPVCRIIREYDVKIQQTFKELKSRHEEQVRETSQQAHEVCIKRVNRLFILSLQSV
jgi:hypothetical protein